MTALYLGGTNYHFLVPLLFIQAYTAKLKCSISYYWVLLVLVATCCHSYLLFNFVLLSFRELKLVQFLLDIIGLLILEVINGNTLGTIPVFILPTLQWSSFYSTVLLDFKNTVLIKLNGNLCTSYSRI